MIGQKQRLHGKIITDLWECVVKLFISDGSRAARHELEAG
jgi:hypothetical protein